jgi:dTDP-4-amino-4,6-dideoxygalactose transaminase
MALSDWLRGSLWEGDAVARLESAFAEFIGVPQALAVPSGRAGLNFIYDALGLERGSEIICSAFGYPVVPHLARSMGYDVRFADCEMETLGMDPEALSKVISNRTRVVLATHLYGVPCRIREIAAICEAHGAVLIEDCAHCYGASIGGQKVGSFGAFGYFSFETSKPINTLGGGMVTTRDEGAAARIREVAAKEPGKGPKWLAKRLLKTTFEATVTNPVVFNLGVYPALRVMDRRDSGDDERFASGYQRDEVTMQGRMGRYTNYQAKLGLAQMERAQPSFDRRAKNARRMIDGLRDRVRFQSNDDPDVVSNYMLVTALFPRMQEMAQRLLRLGVDTKHRYMRDCSGLLDGKPSFPRAAQAEREVLHLPAYPELSDAQIDWAIERIGRAVAEAGVSTEPRPAAATSSVDSRTPS